MAVGLFFAVLAATQAIICSSQCCCPLPSPPCSLDSSIVSPSPLSCGVSNGLGDSLDTSFGGVSLDTSSIYGGGYALGGTSTLPDASICATSQGCTRHRLVPVNRQVVDECIDNVPVVRKSVRQQEETFTRQVPVVEKSVQHQRETTVRHVPVTQKNLRTVVENRVEHVPVVKTRTRTVVEPYTTHVPVTRQSNRQVEESVTRHVPVTQCRLRPVVTQRTRLVPVVEKRLKPVVESHVENVPVRKQIVRNIVEQRAVPVQGPCSCCDSVTPCFGGIAASSDVIPACGSYPSIPCACSC